MTDPIATLSAILRAENDALREFDLAAAGAVLARKQDAITEAEPLLRAASTDPTRAASIRGLAEQAATNRRLLENAMEAQKEVLAILARAARQDRASTGAGAYGSPRRHSATPRGTQLRESAFALHASA